MAIKMEDPTNPPPPSKITQTMAFAYGFMASFVVFILLILLTDPFVHSSSSSSSFYFSDAFRVSHFFPNSSQSFPSDLQNSSFVLPWTNTTVVAVMNQTAKGGIGGLRDEQNGITNTSSTNVIANTSTYNVGTNTSSNGMFSELYEEYESMLSCDLFDGKWVKDDSYPLYPHGECPYIDENFDCFLNGRPDNGYERYRWQPKHCNIPRLKGRDILELIRGKRLVYVGDSLNRNMWDSLACVLKNSLEDQSRVVRNYGRHLFKDYNCSVEFVWSPFLVQESEIPNKDGSKKKRLSLDVIDRKSDKYKDADIIIFNSGHWYTDSKTSNGRNYYQEGSHVYSELNEVEAFRRGMITWGKWVDANVNQMSTQVFFRGISANHFRGGKWNTGGRCGDETEPFKNGKYLLEHPIKMKKFESVMKNMKTRVHYLNITRLTDYRKDGHPAAYRALHLSKERPQDCTHWCLPGVPDTWNEIFYAQILINHYKKHKQPT